MKYQSIKMKTQTNCTALKVKICVAVFVALAVILAVLKMRSCMPASESSISSIKLEDFSSNMRFFSKCIETAKTLPFESAASFYDEALAVNERLHSICMSMLNTQTKSSDPQDARHDAVASGRSEIVLRQQTDEMREAFRHANADLKCALDSELTSNKVETILSANNALASISNSFAKALYLVGQVHFRNSDYANSQATFEMMPGQWTYSVNVSPYMYCCIARNSGIDAAADFAQSCLNSLRNEGAADSIKILTTLFDSEISRADKESLIGGVSKNRGAWICYFLAEIALCRGDFNESSAWHNMLEKIDVHSHLELERYRLKSLLMPENTIKFEERSENDQ